MVSRGCFLGVCSGVLSVFFSRRSACRCDLSDLLRFLAIATAWHNRPATSSGGRVFPTVKAANADRRDT